jgi:hypothetical protein
LRREFEERFTEAKAAQEEAEQRLKNTEEQLVTLIKALLPQGSRPYLHDAGIDTLDVWGLNKILYRHNLEITHELTESPRRTVKTRVGEAAWASATRFELRTYEAPEEPMVDGVPSRFIVPRANYA